MALYRHKKTGKTISWDDTKGRLLSIWVKVGGEDKREESDDNTITLSEIPLDPAADNENNKEEKKEKEPEAKSLPENTFEQYSDLVKNADKEKTAYTTNGRVYEFDGSRWIRVKEDLVEDNKEEVTEDFDWSE